MIDKSITLQHHRSVTELARFLDSSHLAPELQKVPQLFENMTAELLRIIPSTPLLREAMLKIIDAKNMSVIALLHANETGATHNTGDTDGSTAAPSGTDPGTPASETRDATVSGVAAAIGTGDSGNTDKLN